LRKMTHKDKASYDSTPPFTSCTKTLNIQVYDLNTPLCVCVCYVYMCVHAYTKREETKEESWGVNERARGRGGRNHSQKKHSKRASFALISKNRQCGAVCCSVLQFGVVCCSMWQCVEVRCSVLQCVAVCCSVLQCVAVECA